MDKGEAGFTLTELLATVLIVSFMSLAVAGGVSVVKKSLESISLKANSEILLSLSIERIKDELRYAEAVITEDTNDGGIVKVLSYTNNQDGGERRLKNDAAGRGIALEYLGEDISLSLNTETEGNRVIGERELLLVGQSIGDGELYALLGNGNDGLMYDKNTGDFIIGAIAVYRKDGAAAPLSELKDIRVSPLNRETIKEQLAFSG